MVFSVSIRYETLQNEWHAVPFPKCPNLLHQHAQLGALALPQVEYSVPNIGPTQLRPINASRVDGITAAWHGHVVTQFLGWQLAKAKMNASIKYPLALHLPHFKAARHNLLGLGVKAAQMVSTVILCDEAGGMEGNNNRNCETDAPRVCLVNEGKT